MEKLLLLAVIGMMDNAPPVKSGQDEITAPAKITKEVKTVKAVRVNNIQPTQIAYYQRRYDRY